VRTAVRPTGGDPELEGGDRAALDLQPPPRALGQLLVRRFALRDRHAALPQLLEERVQRPPARQSLPPPAPICLVVRPLVSRRWRPTAQNG
jgi:hypothetical protein